MPLTRQKVHSILRRSGLAKHYSTTSAVKGWRHQHSGYEVREDDEHIYVEWYCGNHFLRDEERAKRRADEVEAYRVVLGFFGGEVVSDGGYSKDEPRIRLPKA